MDLSVIILNWNAREWLQRSIGSVLSQDIGSRSFEVIVVDNASTDGSAELVRQSYPGVTLIALPRNIGFAAGNNAAVPQAGGRYILFLNPDTVTHDGALAALLDFADAHPRCGIAGPRLLNLDGSLQYSCRRFPTLEAGLFRNTPLGRLFPGNRATRDYLMKEVPHDRPMPVDWLSGAAMMVRRETIEDIGLLDEAFFFAVEDVDYCYRAHEAGWEVWYVPDGVITHAIGHSSDQNARKVIIEFHRGMYEFFRKHYLGTRYPRWLTPVVAAGLTARAGLVMALGMWHRITGRGRR